MKIEFDNRGHLKINGVIISHELTQPEFEELFFNFSPSKLPIKKSTIYRLQTDEIWLDYLVESIAAEFASGRCRKVSLSLVGPEDKSISSVLDLRVSNYLQMILSKPGKENGKSQLIFEFDYFKISIFYDFKVSSPILEISFK